MNIKKYYILAIVFLLSFMILFTGCGGKESGAAGNMAGNSSGTAAAGKEGGTGRAAKVTAVSGSVTIISSDGKTLPAFEGMSLNQGDSIKTGDNSTLELKIGETKKVRIAQNTELAINSLQISKDSKTENTNMGLDEGVVWINIEDELEPGSEFEIETPTAVMGVRGTIFSVLHSEDTSTLAVIDGSVAATKMTEVKNPDGGTSRKAVTVLVEKNNFVDVNNDIQSEEDFEILPISAASLDPFTLENVKELLITQPDAVDESLKEEINYLDEENQDEGTENLNEGTDDEEGDNTGDNGREVNGEGIELPGFGSINVPQGNNTVEMKLPDGYPEGVVPIIQGGKVGFSRSEGGTFIVLIISERSYQEVKNYYAGVMDGAQVFLNDVLNGNFTIAGMKGGYTVCIMILPEGTHNLQGTGVIIALSPE